MRFEQKNDSRKRSVVKKIIEILVITLLTSCASINKESLTSVGVPNSPENYLGYQPIDPISVRKVSVYDDATGQVKECDWASLNKTKINELLPLQSAQVSVHKNDISGAVSYLSSSVADQAGNYTVTMDYMKYRVEDVVDDATKEFLGNGRIGIGLRITAVIVTNKADLNLGSLFVIGLEAKNGSLKGGISVDVVGIDSSDVTNLIPLTSEIDQTSIQNALQALASIKAKIFDNNTKLTPHLIAVKQAKTGQRVEIMEKTTGLREEGKKVVIEREKKKNEILVSIAPNGTFDKTKWDALVDSSTLPDASKKELKALNDFEEVNRRLDADAAMNGTTISALHQKL
jgi:hypothetical protein